MALRARNDGIWGFEDQPHGHNFVAAGLLHNGA
jgi:hypothetical protein